MFSRWIMEKRLGIGNSRRPSEKRYVYDNFYAERISICKSWRYYLYITQVVMVITYTVFRFLVTRAADR